MSLIFAVIVSKKDKISKTDTCRWTPQLHHHWCRAWDRRVRMEDRCSLQCLLNALAATRRPDNGLRDVSRVEPARNLTEMWYRWPLQNKNDGSLGGLLYDVAWFKPEKFKHQKSSQRWWCNYMISERCRKVLQFPFKDWQCNTKCSFSICSKMECNLLYIYKVKCKAKTN